MTVIAARCKPRDWHSQCGRVLRKYAMAGYKLSNPDHARKVQRELNDAMKRARVLALLGGGDVA